MFHTLAFVGGAAAGAVKQQITARQDQVVPINASGNFIMPQDFTILSAFILGNTITLAQLSTPSLRTVLLPYLSPIQQGAAVPDKPNIVYWYGNSPTLPRLDEVELDVSNAAGAGITIFGVFFVSDNNQQLQNGRIFTARATAANTGGNTLWSNSSIAFDQTLPGGRYMIVGMDVIGANLVAARLVLPGANLRPGCIARTSLANTPSPLFRSGALGNYGWFDSIAPPTMDFLGTAAPVTQEIFLDLIKIG